MNIKIYLNTYCQTKQISIKHNTFILFLVRNFHCNQSVLNKEHSTGFGDWDKKQTVSTK